MAKTYAFRQYREKLFGSLSIGQTMIFLAFLAPAVYLASSGAAPYIVGFFGLAALVAYGLMSGFDADSLFQDIISYAFNFKKIFCTGKDMLGISGIKDIRCDAVLTNENKAVAIIEALPKTLSSLPKQDILMAEKAYECILNGLSGPIQVSVRTCMQDGANACSWLRRTCAVGPLADYMNDLASFAERVCASGASRRRRYFVSVCVPAGKNWQSELDLRVKNIISGLTQCQIDAKRLCGRDVVQAVGEFFGVSCIKGQDPFCGLVSLKEMRGLGLLSQRAGMGEQIGECIKDETKEIVEDCKKEGKNVSSPLLRLANHMLAESVKVGPSYWEDGRKKCCLVARTFPSEVCLGWLTPIVGLDQDMVLSMHINPMGRESSMRYLEDQIRRLETDVTSRLGQGLLVAQKDREELKRAKILIEGIAADIERLYDISFYVEACAKDEDCLRFEVERIRSELASIGVGAFIAKWRQEQGLASCLPLCRDVLAPRSSMSFPSSAVSACYPFLLRGEGESSSVLCGFGSHDGMASVWEPVNMPNPHCLVLGSSGCGKSFLVKRIMLGLCACGYRIFIVDPQGEYSAIVRKMGGICHRLGPDSESSVNLFDLSLKGFDARICAAKAFFRVLRRGPLDGEADALVGKMVEAAYRKCGIHRDDESTHNRTPPTLGDVHQALSALAHDSQLRGDRWRSKMAGSMLSNLAPLVEGELSYMGGQTGGVCEDSKIICFDVSHSGSIGSIERDLVQFIAFERTLSLASGMGSEVPKAVIVDEAWSVLEDNLDWLAPIVRTGRKDNLSVIIIDQNAQDLFAKDSTGQARGHVILNNCATKFIFRQEPDTAKIIGEELDLTKSQKSHIIGCARGDALHVTPNTRLAIHVLASPYELEHFSTNPGQKNELQGQKEMVVVADPGIIERGRNYLVPEGPKKLERLCAKLSERLAKKAGKGRAEAFAKEDSICIKKEGGSVRAIFLKDHVDVQDRGRMGHEQFGNWVREWVCG